MESKEGLDIPVCRGHGPMYASEKWGFHQKGFKTTRKVSGCGSTVQSSVALLYISKDLCELEMCL